MTPNEVMQLWMNLETVQKAGAVSNPESVGHVFPLVLGACVLVIVLIVGLKMFREIRNER